MSVMGMGMSVGQSGMPVPMTVGNLDEIRGLMLVLVILVVLVYMVVLESRMSVDVRVSVGCDQDRSARHRDQSKESKRCGWLPQQNQRKHGGETRG